MSAPHVVGSKLGTGGVWLAVGLLHLACSSQAVPPPDPSGEAGAGPGIGGEVGGGGAGGAPGAGGSPGTGCDPDARIACSTGYVLDSNTVCSSDTVDPTCADGVWSCRRGTVTTSQCTAHQCEGAEAAAIEAFRASKQNA